MSEALELPLSIKFSVAPRPEPVIPRTLNRQVDPRVSLTSRSPASTRPRATLEWLLSDVFDPAYRPLIPDRSVWEWADDFNVFLDTKGAIRSGWYNSARTPHVREFNETMTDPAWKEDLVIKSSRTGYTEAALNNIRFMPRHAPGHTLFAIDSKNEAKNISKDRLEKTLEAAAGEEFPANPDDDGTYTKFLRNMTVYLSGSYSAGVFKNKWLRTVTLDECETKSEITDEGSTFDLAESRMSRHPDAKLFAMSKPKRPGTAFHRRWCTGTRSIRLVPCPHCGTFQELTMFGESATVNLRPVDKKGAPITEDWARCPPPRLGRIVFSHCRDLVGDAGHPGTGGAWDRERVLAETYYECVAGCRITGRELLTADHADLYPGEDKGATEVRRRLLSGERLEAKVAMMLAGRWLVTNARPHPRRRSRHISDLYCLDAEIHWGALALLFIDCEGDASKLLHFFNNNLGLVFRAQTTTLTPESLLDLRAHYYRGTCPFVPDLVTLTFDTQDTHYAAVIMGWLEDGTSCLIDWFDSVADIDIHHRFQAKIPVVAKVLHGAQPSEPPAPVVPQFGLCDAAGHRTDEVYDLCQALSGRLYASFGRGGIQVTTPIRESKITHRMQQMPIYFFSDDTYKTKLYEGRIGRAKDIVQAQAEGKDPVLFNLPPRLYLPLDLDAQTCAELTAEQRRDDGRWDENPGANHKGDAVKLALVLFEWLLPRIRADKARARADSEKSARPRTA